MVYYALQQQHVHHAIQDIKEQHARHAAQDFLCQVTILSCVLLVVQQLFTV